MRAVILVPRRADGGRRDDLWTFTRAWLTRHHPQFEIFEGESPEGPFNRGAAINAAARAAGDWDVAIVHDGDNIVAPAMLEQAVREAHQTGITRIAHDTYMYLDRQSSDEILARPDGPWWPRPQIYSVPTPGDKRSGYEPYVIHKHVSGVVVVPRPVWAATNGFVELTGWGAEDSFHIVLCNSLGGGVEWVRGTGLHLFHDHAPADIARELRRANRRTMLAAKELEARGDIRGLKRYLADLGHRVP